MNPEDQDLRVENSLLRATLWLVARRLKDYQDAPHTPFQEGERPMLNVQVPASFRDKVADALAKANEMLALKEQGGPRR